MDILKCRQKKESSLYILLYIYFSHVEFFFSLDIFNWWRNFMYLLIGDNANKNKRKLLSQIYCIERK